MSFQSRRTRWRCRRGQVCTTKHRRSSIELKLIIWLILHFQVTPCDTRKPRRQGLIYHKFPKDSVVPSQEVMCSTLICSCQNVGSSRTEPEVQYDWTRQWHLHSYIAVDPPHHHLRFGTTGSLGVGPLGFIRGTWGPGGFTSTTPGTHQECEVRRCRSAILYEVPPGTGA